MDNAESNTTPPKPSTGKRWFRFSISTLLLLSVIVALSVSHWTSARDRLALERKLDQLRQDHDLLEITDPTKIHVLPLPSPIHRMGQARVHLPEGTKYLLNFHWRDISFDIDRFDPAAEDQPHTQHPSRELQPGTYLIDYAIQYVPMQGSGRWIVSISAKSQDYEENIYAPLPWEAPKWLEAESVGNGAFRLLDFDPNFMGGGHFSFVDESGLEEGQVTRFDEVDEVTLIQTGVYNNMASVGALIIDRISTDNVFRIWIEPVPRKP